MATHSKNIAYIVAHLALGVSILFTSAILWKTNMGMAALPYAGIPTALGCFYLYAMLIAKRPVNAAILKATWILSGFFTIGLLFTLISSPAPLFFWGMLVIQMLCRVAMMMGNSK